MITSIVFLDDTEQFLRVGERGTNKKPRSFFSSSEVQVRPPKMISFINTAHKPLRQRKDVWLRQKSLKPSELKKLKKCAKQRSFQEAF